MSTLKTLLDPSSLNNEWMDVYVNTLNYVNLNPPVSGGGATIYTSNATINSPTRTVTIPASGVLTFQDAAVQNQLQIDTNAGNMTLLCNEQMQVSAFNGNLELYGGGNVDVECDQSFYVKADNGSIELQTYVSGTNINLVTAGAITMGDLAEINVLEIDTVGGNVSLSALNQLNIETDNQNISIVSGAVLQLEATGDCDIVSSTGGINLDAASGGIDLTASGGDLDLSSTTNNVNIQSNVGDVSIAVGTTLNITGIANSTTSNVLYYNPLVNGSVTYGAAGGGGLPETTGLKSTTLVPTSPSTVSFFSDGGSSNPASGGYAQYVSWGGGLFINNMTDAANGLTIITPGLYKVDFSCFGNVMRTDAFTSQLLCGFSIDGVVDDSYYASILTNVIWIPSTNIPLQCSGTGYANLGAGEVINLVFWENQLSGSIIRFNMSMTLCVTLIGM